MVFGRGSDWDVLTWTMVWMASVTPLENWLWCGGGLWRNDNTMGANTGSDNTMGANTGSDQQQR